MSKKKLTGFYGGTFDPIHFGHLALAVQLLEICQLKEVWFCPALINPYKQNRELAPAHHRMKMLELAIEGVSNTRVLDTETRREGPSYTVDTLKELIEFEKENDSGREFTLIMGNDAIEGFFNWKQAEEIVDMVSLLIGNRSLNDPLEGLKGSEKILSAIQEGLITTKYFEISSTEVRNRVKGGLYIGHQVPEKVVDYIHNNKLYL